LRLLKLRKTSEVAAQKLGSQTASVAAANSCTREARADKKDVEVVEKVHG
jgi:hypothetical protein